MARLLSCCILLAIFVIPAETPDVVGGRAFAVAKPCTGTTGILTCTPVNGGACNNIAGVYVAGGSDKVPTTADKDCQDVDTNCSGSAKKASNQCGSTVAFDRAVVAVN